MCSARIHCKHTQHSQTETSYCTLYLFYHYYFINNITITIIWLKIFNIIIIITIIIIVIIIWHGFSCIKQMWGKNDRCSVCDGRVTHKPWHMHFPPLQTLAWLIHTCIRVDARARAHTPPNQDKGGLLQKKKRVAQLIYTCIRVEERKSKKTKYTNTTWTWPGLIRWPWECWPHVITNYITSSCIYYNVFLAYM